MHLTYSIFPLGDQAVSLEFDTTEINLTVHNRLMRMKAEIAKSPFQGLRDIVVGYRSISVTYDLFSLGWMEQRSAYEHISAILENAFHASAKSKSLAKVREVRIPVCYHSDFGLDLNFVCSRNGIDVSELITLHTGHAYNVYLVGFLPGFPYLGFVPDKLEVPRRDSPRTLVPAGSVGIAGKQTGIYPLDSPGGWQIIGRTPVRIFDPANDPPVLIETGDLVTFYPITKEEFANLQNS